MKMSRIQHDGRKKIQYISVNVHIKYEYSAAPVRQIDVWYTMLIIFEAHLKVHFSF